MLSRISGWSVTIFGWLLALFAGGVCLTAQSNAVGTAPERRSAAATATSAGAQVADVVNRYCVTCHNDRTKSGSLSFQGLDLSDVSANQELMEKILRKLSTGAMPPAGARRPEKPVIESVVTSLDGELGRLAVSHPNPGRPPVHRLNRTEYANAIRDLLDLEIDGRTYFPPDDTGYGFDNNADVLSVSPMLLERYLSAAQKVSRLAVGDPTMKPTVAQYTVGKYVRQDDRRDEDLPFGTRGGLIAHHFFPVDGEYLIKVYLDRTYTGQVRGLAEKDQLQVRINGELIKTFEIGGVQLDAEGNPIPPRTTERGQNGATQEEQARSQAGGVPAAGAQTAGGGGQAAGTEQSGRGAAPPTPAPRRGRIPQTPEQAAAAAKREAERDAKLLQEAAIAGQRAEQNQGADAQLYVKFPAKAGPATIVVTFVAKETIHEGARREPLMITSYEYAGNTVGDAAVGSIDIRGPSDVTGRGTTPSRRRIFTCRPASAADEDGCARKILTTITRRAYRRQATDDDVRPLLAFYKQGRTGRDFDNGIEAALERILVAPDFLFRAETPAAAVPADTAYALSDVQLASRLSFFLWSSIPDDELLDLAIRGRLKDPAVYRQQVRRMLVDRRSSALVTNFASQWLLLRNLRLVTPDPYEFPDFDDNLRQAFQTETEMFLESQIREDHPIPDLLTANYTFLNQRLAEHYGVPNVVGSQFRRVTLNDPMRQGLLGQGSILTVTSYGNRTSPVIRGKFLLENILGTPPPPPPPNVPALKEKAVGEAHAQSVRVRLEEHRSNPVCASCHQRMDPLGFALENFDAIGRYRVKDGDTKIDPSGTMPDGTRLDGPASLRAALHAHPEDFTRTVAEKLLTYAVGRGMEYHDGPAIRQVVRQAASEDLRWSALIQAIAESTPFRMRLAEPTPQLVENSQRR